MVLTPDFLLPLHLIVEVLCLLEEVVHFAALFVPFSHREHPALGLPRQVFTYVGDRKDYLLHGPVVPDNLQTLIQGAF